MSRQTPGDRIVSRIMSGLPDSLEARRAVLDDLMAVVRLLATPTVIKEVHDCSAALAQHLNAQREFPLSDSVRAGGRDKEYPITIR